MGAKEAAELVQKRKVLEEAQKLNEAQEKANELARNLASVDRIASTAFADAEEKILEAAAKGNQTITIDVWRDIDSDDPAYNNLYKSLNTALIRLLNNAGYSSPDNFQVHYGVAEWKDSDWGTVTTPYAFINVSW